MLRTSLLLFILSSAIFAQAPAAPPAQRFQPPMPPGPNPNSQYRLGPDSMPQDGVPKGEVRGPYVLPSKAYPGTQHTYWVYVPAQYDPEDPSGADGLSGWPGVQR